MLNTEAPQPIVVVVKNGRYDCFSLNPNPDHRDYLLMQVIKDLGGINEGVKEGTYHFNAEALDADTVVASLDLVA